jgi:hypothetical protein
MERVRCPLPGALGEALDQAVMDHAGNREPVDCNAWLTLCGNCRPGRCAGRRRMQGEPARVMRAHEFLDHIRKPVPQGKIVIEVLDLRSEVPRSMQGEFLQ